jgi:hypothetical protein
LQQAAVEAYVERRHLYLEGSQVPRLQIQPVVDAFLYQGHIYPAKQPGQFMAGAFAYFPLHALGLSYADNYLLTAALVTFLTPRCLPLRPPSLFSESHASSRLKRLHCSGRSLQRSLTGWRQPFSRTQALPGTTR